jgi:phage-related protein
MADAIEIILSAVDSASEVFQSVISSAQSMADDITGSVGEASSEFDAIAENVSSFSDSVANVDSSTLEELASTLGMDTEEVERLLATGADIGSLSAGFNEAAVAADELEKEIQEDTDAMTELGSAGDVMAAQTFMDMANGMKDSMLGMADSAGTFNDSIMRASLEAQGAGISVDAMKQAVSDLSETTGRAGGQIRESFIKATARGVTDMNSFKTMMEGAGAQATLLGTDIQTMGDKFSSMAQKDTLMARSLAETGITMNELADAMGMTGATADEVKAKWKELDTNQRAAILGTAASMNEGKNANDEYKHSWAGLQEQMNIAQARLERLVGSVLLPTLIPAMQIASGALSAVGDVISGVMSGPLGGLISLIGSLAAAFMIGVTGAAALRTFMGFLKLEMMLDTAATIFNTAAKILNGEASGIAAIGNALLGESFMASAAAAWAAAAGFLAAAWPLLLIVGVIALVVAAIYEIGKAFGWWTDVSSMIDAISAGLGRLWNAFINHPDVQAVISAISNAWNSLMSAIQGVGQAIMEFFGISTGGNFDIVSALIHGIGDAWNAIREPIMAVIDIFSVFYESISGLITGQMDLQTAVLNVWSALATNIPVVLQFIYTYLLSFVVQLGIYAIQAGLNFVNGIISYVSQLPGRVMTYLIQVLTNVIAQTSRWVSTARSRASQLVTNVISFLRQLPGRALSALLGVVSSIVSAGSQWISHARQKASEVVSSVVNTLTGLPGKISSALSGVVSAITAPFKQAYDTLSGIVDNIKSKASEVTGIAFGGETAWGGETAIDLGTGNSFNTNTGAYNNESSEINVNVTEKIILDLVNVPAHIDSNTLIRMLQDKEVLKSLTRNKDFQDLDNQVKQELMAKIRRSKGA